MSKLTAKEIMTAVEFRFKDIQVALSQGNTVAASIEFEVMIRAVINHIATDRNVHMCCQDYIVDICKKIDTLPYINITRAP